MPKDNFISAAAFLRQQPLAETVLALATYHAMFSSKREVRSMVDITAAYHLRKTMTHRNLQAVQ
jgi:hypothetical protein